MYRGSISGVGDGTLDTALDTRKGMVPIARRWSGSLTQVGFSAELDWLPMRDNLGKKKQQIEDYWKLQVY